MRVVKRIIFFVIAVLAVLATVVFTMENQKPVTLVFFGWSAPELPTAVPVIIALVLGMLIGPLLGWSVVLRSKNRLRSKS
jgi:uncharacterized integral membrane protein